ncbi:MAG: hypothetical protein ABI206_11925, partial [Antricoccus sp.]
QNELLLTIHANLSLIRCEAILWGGPPAFSLPGVCFAAVTRTYSVIKLQNTGRAGKLADYD